MVRLPRVSDPARFPVSRVRFRESCGLWLRSDGVRLTEIPDNTNSNRFSRLLTCPRFVRAGNMAVAAVERLRYHSSARDRHFSPSD